MTRFQKAGISLGVCAGVLALLALPHLGTRQASTSPAYVEQPAERRDIASVYTGSGALSAANAYTVKAVVQGTVLTADFELGDRVEQGDVLYTLDSTECAAEVESAQLTLQAAERSLTAAENAQNVRSSIAGQVARLYAAPGDAVTAGQTLALVRDSSTLLLALTFPAAEAEGFAAGQAAQVTLDDTFEILPAAVRAVSGIVQSGENGTLPTRTVTLAVPNPGSLTCAQAATASVNGVAALDSAAFTCLREQAVTAPADGTVASVCIPEGGNATQNAVLLTLESDTLTQSVQDAADRVRSAQLAKQAAERKLSSYTITSPISGTVVQKNVKAGDVLGADGTGSEPLCTIYDLSHLELTLNVDELKIRSFAVGQTVDLTADAVPGETYTGIVTAVLLAGTTQSGTTTYPVTVRIDEGGELRPGMNVTAAVTTAEAKQALTVPLAALARGSYVLVTASSPSAAHADPSMPAPDGYAYVHVETGISDDDFIEVTDGLQDGDIVAYDPETAAPAEDTDSTGVSVTVS